MKWFSLLFGVCVAMQVAAKPKAPPKAPPVAPAPVPAPEPTPADVARAAKARGDDALDRGRPSEALTAYEASYAAVPNPALLYNRARAHERLGQYPRALELLERFKLDADAALLARVPKLDELLDDYRKRTTRLFISVDQRDVEVRLGETVVGKTPLPQPLVVNAGPATALTIANERFFPVEKSVELPGGGDVHLDLSLASKQTKSVLRVNSAEAGAMATVDDAQRGNVPLDAVVEPGTHQVELVKEGFLRATTTVLVQAGELRLVDIMLQREPRLYERWWFWTAIGAAVAAGVGVAVAYSIERPAPRGSLNTGEPPIAPAALPRFSF